MLSYILKTASVPYTDCNTHHIRTANGVCVKQTLPLNASSEANIFQLSYKAANRSV